MVNKPNVLFDTARGDVSSNALQSLGLAPGGLFTESFASTVSAGTVVGQSNATALVSEVNLVTTAATLNGGVLLPASAPGLTILVINATANSITVFGAGSDTVNGVTATTGITQMQNSVCLYVCGVAGNWNSEGTATGYNGSFQTYSAVDGITGAVAPGTALTAMLNRVTTNGTAGYGVQLPLAAPGLEITVLADYGVANSVVVNRAGADVIVNGTGGSLTSYTIVKGFGVNFYSTIAGKWHMILSGA